MSAADIVFTTVSVFMNRSNQAIRIPKEMSFPGVTRLEARKVGDVLMLRPVRPTWASFRELPVADDDFLVERTDVLQPGRVDFGDGQVQVGGPSETRERSRA